jgi:hypothetical protein
MAKVSDGESEAARFEILYFIKSRKQIATRAGERKMEF